MTKPTGRPRGRPKIKEYVTLMARVPMELVEQARGYAGRKQRSISEVLRDGLLLLLEREDTTSHYMYDRNVLPVNMSDTKEDALTLNTQQPVIMSYTKQDSLSRGTLPVKMSDTKETIVVPPFDTTKHRLGKLCRNKDEWGSSGQSLRNADNQCLACKARAKREKDAKKRAAREAQPVSG